MVLLGPRAWKRWWITLIRDIPHEQILEQVEQDASLSFNFSFMLVIASGIATIGLLLNSPAVIIGAMLISPLMGPIVAGGMALATLDADLGRRAARTLIVGIGAAILFTALIVFFSPVRELTPELLARTRPNLFDLIVAILSGAAGGYAMIRGRGGAIVGVAIATALMPPLATVGYGLVTMQWIVARGALLLFITNIAAIGLTVAVVAEWYGFGRGGLRKQFARQAVFSLLILAPLAIPLFFSLQRIAFESRAQGTIRSTLEAAAAELPDGQLGELDVEFLADKPLQIRAALFSSAPAPNLSARIEKQLVEKIGRPVELHLSQLRTEGPVPPELLVTGRIVREKQEFVAALRAGFPFPLAAFDANLEQRRVVIVPQPQDQMTLAAWRAMDSDLSKRNKEWSVEILPPLQPLPMIRFGLGSSVLEGTGRTDADAIIWALQRWKISKVRVTGYASSDGGGSSRLAKARAETVSFLFEQNGFEVDAQPQYPAPLQKISEREQGNASFRAVSVSLPIPTQPAPRRQ